MIRLPTSKGKPFVWLLVDGTQVHLQGAKGKDLGKVQMRWARRPWVSGTPLSRWAFGSMPPGAAFANSLPNGWTTPNLLVPVPDGEPGISREPVEQPHASSTLCWHGKRDFPYLLYADELKKADQKPFIHQLNAIAAMTMTQAQLERLRPQDRPR